MLIVGSDSTIGRSLLAFYEKFNMPIWCTTRHRDKVNGRCLFLDLSDDMADWPLPPTPIKTAIFCAAVTSQERCQIDPEFSYNVNVRGTVALAKRLVENGVFVIYLSSNAVFNGEIPFTKPSDSVTPKTEYGRQKVEAENQLLKSGNKVAIVRLSKVITPEMPLIKSWIRDLMAEKVIHPFNDMKISPVPVGFAVSVFHEIALRQLPGIFHISAKEDVAYSKMALYIALKLGFDEKLIQPISFQDIHQTFVPRNTTLDSSRLSELGMFPPDVWTGLRDTFELENYKSTSADYSINTLN